MTKISERKFREIIRYFSEDIHATSIASLTGLNRNTVNRFLGKIRERMAEACDEESPFQGEIEVDESYFGARRVRGKRGRGAYGKTIVVGLLKRGGKVHAEIVPNCSRKTLRAIILGNVEMKSIIHSDRWKGYDGLVDLGYQKHYRVHHGNDEFVRGKSHINGIEGFWSYAKTRLSKFRGMRRTTFHLHLKECEFRFNHRKKNLSAILLTMLRKSPLF
jgi:transposase-like protein